MAFIASAWNAQRAYHTVVWGCYGLIDKCRGPLGELVRQHRLHEQLYTGQCPAACVRAVEVDCLTVTDGWFVHQSGIRRGSSGRRVA
jgi:hypothetical protein